MSTCIKLSWLQGPILGFIYAVKELLEEGKASKGSLPVNVAFVFEGEEENGSVGFEEAVRGNLHWFEGTQLVVISNTLWVGERVPCLTYGEPPCSVNAPLHTVSRVCCSLEQGPGKYASCLFLTHSECDLGRNRSQSGCLASACPVL